MEAQNIARVGRKIPWYRQLVVIGYLSFLIGLGVRSIVKDDARCGWLMFTKQVDCDLNYAWVTADGSLEPVPNPRVACVAAPAARSKERRRRWPPSAATHGSAIGWADPRRRAAVLVACVPDSSTPHSSRLARLATGPSAGHGRVRDGL